MKGIKGQLKTLMIEVTNRKSTSISRVLEIKEKLLSIAADIDSNLGTETAVGMIEELYSKETRYERKMVKRAIELLLGYCE